VPNKIKNMCVYSFELNVRFIILVNISDIRILFGTFRFKSFKNAQNFEPVVETIKEPETPPILITLDDSVTTITIDEEAENLANLF
jgi:hypothetical protein